MCTYIGIKILLKTEHRSKDIYNKFKEEVAWDDLLTF
jgi:hypothetical protein